MKLGLNLLPLIILPLLFAFFLIAPEATIAKSGCCSSHGGVDCAAGPQGNGNVICNDGWRGSSCSYSEMVMCGGSSTTAPTATPTPTRLKTSTPTPKPTYTSTPTPTPTPTAAPTSEVKAAETEAPLPTPTGIPTPTPTPNPLTAGETVAVWSILVLMVSLPAFLIYKVIKRIRNKRII